MNPRPKDFPGVFDANRCFDFYGLDVILKHSEQNDNKLLPILMGNKQINKLSKRN
jgi:hypothetical protein